MDESINTKRIAEAYCQALGNRNLECILTLIADQIDWYIPGNEKVAPWTGRRNNKYEIQTFFQLLWENTEPLGASIDHVIAKDDFAVITGKFSTRMLTTMKVVDSIFSIQLTVKEGLIVCYRLQEDSFAVSAALQ